MAGCGISCRRLRGEDGIKVEPDCCGGCVVSIDPDCIPAGDGITEQKAKEIADAAAKKAADALAAKTTDVHGIPDTAALETKTGAQNKADKARDDAIAAANKCCAESTGAARDADAKLQQQIDDLKNNGTPTGGGWDWKGTYDPATAYKKGSVVFFNGSSYHAPADIPAGTEPPAAPWAIVARQGDPGPAGTFADTFRGPFDPATAYKTGDLVEYKGSTYLAPADIPAGTEPPAAPWKLVAAAGNGGEGGGITEDKAKEIANTAATDAVKKHTDTCHTLGVIKEGVTAEEGWEVTTQELRSIGGTRTAVIWLKRTGDNIISKAPDDPAADGKPEQGNIVPDLLIAKVTKDWIPPVTQLHSAHTGYTTGSVRINTKGEIYLADLTYNNALRTDQFLVFEYEFQVKTGCEGGEGGPGPTPPDGGITEERAKEIADAAAKAAIEQYMKDHPCDCLTEEQIKQIADAAAKKAVDDNNTAHPPGISEAKAKEIADAAAKKAADDHAAKTTDVHGIPDTAALETKDGAQAKADAAEKNALDSLRALVEKCLTLQTLKEGVTAQDGWTVHTQELRSIGGTHNAVIWLKRTGDNISSKTADQNAGDGKPEEGNIVPDLLIAKVAKDWTPAQTILVSAHTGYTTGSVRINTKGEIYLADLTSNNALRTDQFLVFTYTFLTEPDCAAAIKDPSGTPDATVKPDPQDPSGRTALLTIADSGGS